MTKEQIEKLFGLLARAKAVWTDPRLCTLTEETTNPTQAYERMLEATKKRKKALAARWYAIALRDFDRDIVGASVRYLRANPGNLGGLVKLLVTPIVGKKGRVAMSSERMKQILSPLAGFVSKIKNEDGGIGGFWSSRPMHPTVTHTDFVIRNVLPRIEQAFLEAGKEFDAEQVAADLLEIGLIGYSNLPSEHASDSMAIFWNDVVSADRSEEKRNHSLELMARLGIKQYLGPIMQLARVHAETKVFDSSASKFFHCHACRLSIVPMLFSYQDYLDYMDLTAKLLRHGVYDWSIENTEQEWKLLSPAIQKYGLRATVEPFVNVAIAVSNVPGTKESKYKYSFVSGVTSALYATLMPMIMENGPGVIEPYFAPLTSFILDMHRDGAFRDEDRSWYIRFFDELRGAQVSHIASHGMTATLESIRPKWTKALMGNC
jgi:hypothetical protein